MKSIFVGLAILSFALIGAFFGVQWFLFHQMQKLGTTTFKSYTDEFHVKVVETKSTPGLFTQRLLVTCDNDMEVGIDVVDLKKSGVHEMRGTNGELFYLEGHPYEAGQSQPVHADGKTSFCEILYRVSTTSSNTAWHSTITLSDTNASSNSQGSSGCDTTFTNILTVTGLQTNWPNGYRRNSWIPLANLGEYRIVVIGK